MGKLIIDVGETNTATDIQYLALDMQGCIFKVSIILKG